MRKRITYKEAMDAIVESFEGNKDKAIAWWMNPNPFFKNRKPFDMVKEGDSQELMKFVRTRLCDTVK